MLVDWAAAQNGETCEGRLLIKPLRVESWRKIVFSRVEIWWSAGSRDGVTRGQTAGSLSTQTDLSLNDDMDFDIVVKHRHVVKIQVILAQNEWSSWRHKSNPL